MREGIKKIISFDLIGSHKLFVREKQQPSVYKNKFCNYIQF